MTKKDHLQTQLRIRCWICGGHLLRENGFKCKDCERRLDDLPHWQGRESSSREDCARVEIPTPVQSVADPGDPSVAG